MNDECVAVVVSSDQELKRGVTIAFKQPHALIINIQYRSFAVGDNTSSGEKVMDDDLCAAVVASF
ncbi:hypothetical protein LWM68_29725 [Niabella sp. W65]|nr:hypothetical protein [Niabella sp. W65]MCH7366577.1 hypothetical protein [Niabella sp. W65]ULT42286.1 hypothetical protein KRR40_01185 [Niabella sp. I65]